MDKMYYIRETGAQGQTGKEFGAWERGLGKAVFFTSSLCEVPEISLGPGTFRGKGQGPAIQGFEGLLFLLMFPQGKGLEEENTQNWLQSQFQSFN